MKGIVFRSGVLASLAIAALSLAGGCKDNTTNPVNPGTQATITIVPGAMSLGENAYTPNPDTVAVGTTVRWVNTDSIQHTATSDTGVFSLTIPGGTSKSFTFATAGSYPYHCAMPGHTMSGMVVVR